MKKKYSFPFKCILSTFFLSFGFVNAQNSFYDVNKVREIKIYFSQPNWDYILDTMFISGIENRLVATSVIINGVKLDSVGIRYKGYSSASVNREKNPFNLKLNYIKKDQAYKGVNKIKLSNVFQDPSFIREVLSYEIARKYMPASLANFANVFINDELIGLYSNIESVDNKFLQKHYHSSKNTFVKGNPESLDLNGENSNLSNSPGTDSTLYYPLYEVRSEYGWTELYNLIDTLNTSKENIEKVLNVDRALWMHAFNYSLMNFDSYVGYSQNYYLYKDNNGQFNTILWDLNQSFSSFRLADASIHFDGFGIAEAKEMDPLLHHNNISVYPRPLMRNLFNDDRYRKMYIAHMRTIMKENFANQDYLARGQVMQTLIDSDVKKDLNKFFSYADFKMNLNSTVTDLILHPGISDLMDARNTYLSTYNGFQGSPEITNIKATPNTPSIGDNIWINAELIDEDNVILAYRFNNSGLFNKVDMFDDGLHNDGLANDGTYGFQLMNTGSITEYYIYAENDVAGKFAPERAAYETFTITTYDDVVINEISASNRAIQPDQDGEYDDWIELYNNTGSSISLDGYHLSNDKTNLAKWTFPTGTSIKGNDYLIIWADNDLSQKGLHANFKLSASGETLFLSDNSNKRLDETTFHFQDTDITWGRSPNGSGDFGIMVPTYSSINSNQSVGIENILFKENKLVIYPNPANSNVTFQVEQDGDFDIIIRDINGRGIATDKIKSSSSKQTKLNLSNFASGLYFVTIVSSDFSSTKKLIIQK